MVRRHANTDTRFSIDNQPLLPRAARGLARRARRDKHHRNTHSRTLAVRSTARRTGHASHPHRGTTDRGGLGGQRCRAAPGRDAGGLQRHEHGQKCVREHLLESCPVGVHGDRRLWRLGFATGGGRALWRRRRIRLPSGCRSSAFALPSGRPRPALSAWPLLEARPPRTSRPFSPTAVQSAHPPDSGTSRSIAPDDTCPVGARESDRSTRVGGSVRWANMLSSQLTCVRRSRPGVSRTEQPSHAGRQNSV